MAFTQTPKRHLKSQVLKNQILAISFPTPRFCLSCKLPAIEPWSTAALPTFRLSTVTNKPNTQAKECYLDVSMKPFRSTEL